ncbi:hypothetical protein C8Q80DRAFT_357167 [Daedaleopsis nitida]|nr:hypothetical protein C8Q80DRAFT_357167 [Daedaleopsis nitida]
MLLSTCRTSLPHFLGSARLRSLHIRSLALSDGSGRRTQFEWGGCGRLALNGFTSYLLPYTIRVPIPRQDVRRLELEPSHTTSNRSASSLYVTPGSLRTLIIVLGDLDAMCTFLWAAAQGLEDVQLDVTIVIDGSEAGFGATHIDWALVFTRSCPRYLIYIPSSSSSTSRPRARIRRRPSRVRRLPLRVPSALLFRACPVSLATPVHSPLHRPAAAPIRTHGATARPRRARCVGDAQALSTLRHAFTRVSVRSRRRSSRHCRTYWRRDGANRRRIFWT